MSDDQIPIPKDVREMPRNELEEEVVRLRSHVGIEALGDPGELSMWEGEVWTCGDCGFYMPSEFSTVGEEHRGPRGVCERSSVPRYFCPNCAEIRLEREKHVLRSLYDATVANLTDVQARCTELVEELRASKAAPLLPGWECKNCLAFNGEAKERRQYCRACGCKKSAPEVEPGTQYVGSAIVESTFPKTNGLTNGGHER